MNSHTEDNMGEIPGTSIGILESNQPIRAKSSELIDLFSKKKKKKNKK